MSSVQCTTDVTLHDKHVLIILDPLVADDEGCYLGVGRSNKCLPHPILSVDNQVGTLGGKLNLSYRYQPTGHLPPPCALALFTPVWTTLSVPLTS